MSLTELKKGAFPVNNLDTVLQSVCPSIMVPRFEALSPLTTHGHRFLTAHDGLFVELRRPWLYTILPIAQSAIRLPYGAVEPTVKFSLRQLPALVARFVREARAFAPNEHAAWFSMDTQTGDLVYEDTEITKRTPTFIQYRRPPARVDRVLAVDIHSHGYNSPGFSPTDNEDANDDAKLEIVVGHLGRDQFSVCCRLSLVGISVDYSEWLASLLYDDEVSIV